jgi:hypothetical protein
VNSISRAFASEATNVSRSVTADWVGRLYELLPVVHHFETAFGGTLVRGFLLENLLELDLAFERAGQFSIWARRG